MLVSNLLVGPDVTVQYFEHWTLSQRFTTGSESGGYTLGSVDVVSEDVQGDEFSLSVCTVDASGFPTTTCTKLWAPGSFLAGTLTFTAPLYTELEANTTYAVVAERPERAFLTGTAGNEEDSGGAAGWSIGNSLDFYNPGTEVWSTHSSESLRIAVNGSVGFTTPPPNVAPVFTGGTSQTRSLAETVGDETVTAATVTDIGDPVAATDDADDGDDTLTYSLGGRNAGAFTIDETSGQLRTRETKDYDYEAKQSYSVTVTVTDGRVRVTADVTINVTDDMNEVPVTPAAPVVSATPGSTSGLDVSWTAPENEGRPAITHYDLRYKKTADPGWTDGPEDESGTSAGITGLEAGTSYDVQVRAVNDDGDGAWSPSRTGSTAGASTDATLGALVLSDAADTGNTDLITGFASGTTSYAVAVANTVETVTIAATPAHRAAAVAISPADSDGNANGHQVALVVGTNTLTATVTAQDTAITRTYTVTVTRGGGQGRHHRPGRRCDGRAARGVRPDARFRRPRRPMAFVLA